MTVHRVLAQACLAACLLWIPSHAQATTTAERCAKADVTLTQTGRGDSDHDGISNCTERYILGTSSRDWDSDDDDVADGQEVADGTNPVDADSDDDGLSDGAEEAVGSDPLDVDSDDDGDVDGIDDDPSADLDSEIRGAIGSLTCPTGGADGSIVVLGVTIAVNDQTRFEGPQDCASLQAAIAANGGAHAQVEVQDGGGLVADKISVDDADNDGSPNHVDADDDNDGTPDVADVDDDDNGVPDVEDSGHHSEESGHS